LPHVASKKLLLLLPLKPLLLRLLLRLLLQLRLLLRLLMPLLRLLLQLRLLMPPSNFWREEKTGLRRFFLLHILHLQKPVSQHLPPAETTLLARHTNPVFYTTQRT
jgi:hypothetical protein